MLGAILLTVILQLAVVYVPVLQAIFGTTAMPVVDLAVAVLAGLTMLLAVEAWKWALRRRTPTADLDEAASFRAGG
jgi:P-type Ca2+ transporter type 2C